MNADFDLMILAPDGELLGTSNISLSKLSPKWLTICRAFLHEHGLVFKESWGQQLGHIVTRMTGVQGAYLATFLAGGELGVTTLIFEGKSEEAERQVADMLFESLADTAQFRASKQPRPFEAIRVMKQRPVAFAIIWGNARIPSSDNDLLRELAIHFSAACICEFAG